MSKTTPEEAEELAIKHGGAVLHFDQVMISKKQLAALIDEVRGVDAEPVAGGSLGLIETHPNYVAGFKAGHAAGRRRIEPAPSQPAAPVELPVVGALWEYIGNDPMGHRTRPCARALHEMNPDNPPYSDTWRVVDKLVKLSDAQAAIAAGRKAS